MKHTSIYRTAYPWNEYRNHTWNQYDETNVMQFSFNLLRIKSLCLFQALFAHHKEALNKRHLVVKLQPYHSQPTSYGRNIPTAVCVAPPDYEQALLETCRGSSFSIKWMKSASRWFHHTDILWRTVSKTLSNTWKYSITFCYVSGWLQN
jgi:hypothetical protein